MFFIDFYLPIINDATEFFTEFFDLSEPSDYLNLVKSIWVGIFGSLLFIVVYFIMFVTL